MIRMCWCGCNHYNDFSADYSWCSTCKTLVGQSTLDDEDLSVHDDDTDFYGKTYWLKHQSDDLNHPNIFERAREDLINRNLHWLKILLKYKAPPSKIFEIGCSHGSFVGLLREAGFDASGMEMSPWVVEFARKTFDIPMLVGPIENVELDSDKFDVILLMDVLEHLPDPIATMSHALRLLKPDGIMIVQTPEAKEDMIYPELVAKNSPFLIQFKSDEHLYLYTKNSVKTLFDRIGASFMKFEPAIFSNYDMFFVVSRAPIVSLPDNEVQNALTSPKGRFVQALLDLYARVNHLETEVGIITEEAEKRLDQIHTLTSLVKEYQTKTKD